MGGETCASWSIMMLAASQVHPRVGGETSQRVDAGNAHGVHPRVGGETALSQCLSELSEVHPRVGGETTRIPREQG